MAKKRKPNGYWTLARLKADAKRYKNKTEWRAGNSSAYSLAKKGRLLDQCCGHMEFLRKPNHYWNRDRCIESASKFKTITEWVNGEQSAYNSAIANGWHDECCAHMVMVQNPIGYWTRDRCLESARKYKNRAEWKNSEMSAYQAAREKGFFDECTAHMPPSRRRAVGYWTKALCMDSASRYNTKSDWVRGEETAVKAARLNGCYDECCAHMEDGGRSDNDAIYIWRAPSEIYNSLPVYKVGITSHRLGDQRIKQVRKDAEIIILSKVSGKATDVEKQLLKIGHDPQYVSGDGRTEFRAMSQSQLTKAISIIEAAR